MSMLMASSRTEDPVLLKGLGKDLVVAGYASVEMVDKQGDLITRAALGDAFKKYMKNPEFRNVQLAHSNIQVGSVVPSYTDSSGRVWKSEVDDTGLFVVISLRNDIEKAREVAAEVRKGNLKSFSIGGQAFERVNKHDSSRGDYREISRMELHEVTICEKGINPEAQFRILKEDNSMSESDTMNELHSVLERLSKRLDAVEKADEEIENSDEDVERALPFLDGGDDEKPPAKKKSKKKDDDDDDSDDDDDDGDDDMTMAYSDGLADTITTDYLTWLEQTAKASGHDPSVARAHFDGVAKGYGPGQHGFDHRGQGSIEGAGEDDSSKRPKMNMGSAPSGNKTVIKQDFIAPSNVSNAQIEEAYEVYKAATVEKQFKNSLGNYFEDRLSKEQAQARNAAAKQAYDSRSPIHDLQKAVLALNERINTVSTGGGETITKSAGASIAIPETVELASMSWDDVHRLAGKALKGE